MIATTSQVGQILALAVVLVVVVAFAAVVIAVWDRAPWWRTIIKPSRAYRNDKETVKRWKLRQEFPEAFEDPALSRGEPEDL